MHIVLIDLHTEHSRVPLYVVPFGVGLQSLQRGGVLQPRLQFGGVDEEVDDTLRVEERICWKLEEC